MSVYGVSISKITFFNHPCLFPSFLIPLMAKFNEDLEIIEFICTKQNIIYVF